MIPRNQQLVSLILITSTCFGMHQSFAENSSHRIEFAQPQGESFTLLLPDEIVPNASKYSGYLRKNW